MAEEEIDCVLSVSLDEAVSDDVSLIFDEVETVLEVFAAVLVFEAVFSFWQAQTDSISIKMIVIIRICFISFSFGCML